MSIFSRKMRLLCLLYFKHFATLLTKVYEQLIFFLRGMFSFKCSLVRLFEKTNISVPLQQPKNALSSSIKV